MSEKINLLYIGSNKEVVDSLIENPRVSIKINDNITLTNDDLISTDKPGIIFCDRFLPEGDSFSVYRIIRAYRAWDSVPFILVADAFDEGLITRAMKEGMDDIYILPLPSSEDLLSRVNSLMDFKMQKQAYLVNWSSSSHIHIPLSKRLFDIVVASLALILLSPILLLVMIAIRIESKGKVYYTSVRVGQKPFNFYKFRSMRNGAEDELKKLAKQKNQ
jgi:CheY-like chemotaxis protein